MGILNSDSIRRLVENEDSLLPFAEHQDEKMLQGANLNLRLGAEAYVSSQAHPVILDEKRNPTMAVEPGEFALLMTYEHLKMPLNMLGLIGIRFQYKLYGLINVSGFHVDPGFEGPLIFSVYNAGPRDVVLRYKDAVFMLVLAQLVGNAEPYTGRFKDTTTLPVEAITGLRGASASLTRLSNRLDNVDTALKIYGAILVTLTIGVLLSIFRMLMSMNPV